jgi:benzoyl-CoA 2,3-dioxygenase component B
MLTEEAHHMFVGQTGVGRVIQKTCELMRDHPDADVREFGAIPLDLIQRYVNYWNSSSNDLFGAEISSNSANFFRSGLKGRAYEDKQDDHLATEGSYTFHNFVDGRVSVEEVPLRNAMNEVLRDEYVRDNEKGVAYWNKIIAKTGVDAEIRLPHRRFNRSIGVYAGHRFDLEGNPISADEWNRRVDGWLPTQEDRDYVKSLMVPVREPGKFASWIAEPARGIDSQPIEKEYVKL